MIITVIPKSLQTETEWSGGTTCQLFIYPENSSYDERNFLCRISSAKVEVMESTFTKLDTVKRAIMILDGEIKLTHESRYTKVLRKFDTDIFDGNWDTTAYGRCTDFNLMTRENFSGTLQSIVLKYNQTTAKKVDTKIKLIGYYLLHGAVELSVQNQKYVLHPNDFILLMKENRAEEFKINASEYSELVEVEIFET